MPNPLVDTFGRQHDNLRLSVTDRCNIRCFYCMPEKDVRYVPHAEVLSFEEIERFARLSARMGVKKLRITGGEPLVRRDLHLLVSKLEAIEEITDIALTTNGVLLEEQAEDLYRAGLRRLNIHLDTLDRQRFIDITRRDELGRVLRGIDRALELGFGPIKINAVAVKGLVEQDIVPLALFAGERGIEVRYIEFMPLDAQGIWDKRKVLLADEILEILTRQIGPLEAVANPDPRAPALEYRFAGGGRIGFIASVSRPFCLNCNRIRLTADGMLRYCLFAIEETDIKGPMRAGRTDEEIERIVQETVRSKWLGHEINQSRFVAPPRPMHAIGG